MKCYLEGINKKYVEWREEVDKILSQHDHAYGNGKPPVFERKSYVDYTLKSIENKRKK